MNKKVRKNEKGWSSKRTSAPYKACDPLQISDQQYYIHRPRYANLGSQNSHWVWKMRKDARAYKVMRYNMIIKQLDHQEYNNIENINKQ